MIMRRKNQSTSMVGVFIVSPLLLCLVLLLSDSVSSAPLRIVATTPDLAAIASTIGGDRADVTAIARGHQDPHFVDAKPSLIVKLSKADVLLIVGRELEAPWLPQLIRTARNRRILPGSAGYVDCSKGIRILEEHSHGDLSRAHGDVHPHGNPHWYLDPMNHLIASRTIRDALRALDPAGAEAFSARQDAYAEKLKAAMAEWASRMAPWKGVEVLTYHRSWIYFADRYGLAMETEIEPRPGIPPSPSHTRAVIDAVKDRRIPLVFQDPYYDPAAGTEIARRAGAAFLVLPSMVGGEPGITDVFGLFDALTGRIAGVLAARRDVPRHGHEHHDHDHDHDHDHHHDHAPQGGAR